MSATSRRTVRSVLLAALVSAAFLLSAPSAEANYWRHCGDPPGNNWFNLKAHNIHCLKARAVWRRYTFGGDFTPYGFRCGGAGTGYETGVTRCRRVRHHRVQKVQWGSGA
jgi:hypothetical protein